MVVVLILIALGAGGIGALLLSQATMGVGLICGGCLAAVLARVWQAAAHQDELRELLKK